MVLVPSTKGPTHEGGQIEQKQPISKIETLQQDLPAERPIALPKGEKPSEAPKIAEKPQTAPKVSGKVANCGDNHYANYIYMKESGCNTTALNPIGCYGIGQSCPRSKIAHCGADYACQNAWFSNYAQERYGGWQGAYNFWLKNHWW